VAGELVSGRQCQYVIGKENYFLRADGLLMPAKKNQAPPDLRNFTQAPK
jgi:hypothetical protein